VCIFFEKRQNKSECPNTHKLATLTCNLGFYSYAKKKKVMASVDLKLLFFEKNKRLNLAFEPRTFVAYLALRRCSFSF
jgi:hypothetical protein